MKIQVTEEHIRKGRMASCTGCPIALALKDAGWTQPFAGPSFLQDYQGTSRTRRFEIPSAVEDFMRVFDNGGIVQPFEFSLGEA